MNSFDIGVIGATGIVGQTFLRILKERQFPYRSIRLCASKRSIGKNIKVGEIDIAVEEASPRLFSEVDIAFISANTEVSKDLAPVAVRNGAMVIDDSSAFRMQSNVPLVIPEVNPEDLENHCGIVSIPNCSTTPLAMILKPLMNFNPIKRVIADTYQSVSGTGTAALQELNMQSQLVLNGRGVETAAYPHQIAFNLIPHIESFQENGYTKEEMKIRDETRKILHDSDMMISATCVRVPVATCHSEAIHIEFKHPIKSSTVRDILASSPGIRVVDDPKANVYPMPIDATGENEVFVGRIRKDLSSSNGIALWVVSDNLRKGAALNAIQIAEELISKNLLN